MMLGMIWLMKSGCNSLEVGSGCAEWGNEDP